MGARVELDSGYGEGYLSIPTDETGPAVVVLHEWWGLSDFIENYVDELAASGFVAIAPDLYGGELASGPAEARKLRDAIDVERAFGQIDAAARFAMERPECTSSNYGVVGFSIGGGLAQALATRDEKVGAAVSYYGTFARVSIDWQNLKAPLLLIFADRDLDVPSSQGIELQKELREAGFQVEVSTYDADHGFANSGLVEVYDEEAAADAYNETVEILRQTLRGGEVRARDY